MVFAKKTTPPLNDENPLIPDLGVQALLVLDDGIVFGYSKSPLQF